MTKIRASVVFVAIVLAGLAAACQLALDFGDGAHADGTDAATASEGGSSDGSGDALGDASVDSAVAELHHGDPAVLLAADEARVYWIPVDAGAVYASPLAGGTRQSVVDARADAASTTLITSGLVAAGGRVFFVRNPNCPTVTSVAPGGTIADWTTYATSVCVPIDHFAVVGSSVFVLHVPPLRVLEEIPVSNGNGGTKLTNAIAAGFVTASNAWVYVASPTEIRAYPRVAGDAGIGASLVSSPSVNGPRGLGIEGDALYWVNQNGVAMTAPATPGSDAGARALNDAGNASATKMVLADAWVVWTDETDRVVAVPKAGGDVHVVATGQSAPTALATNGTTAFWSTADGFIRSAALP